jgi:hypothetical protein
MRLSTVVYAWLALVCSVSFAQSAFDVKWANERLTVSAANAPLIDVVREVSRLSGIEVVGAEKLSGSVSAEFRDLAPKQALDTLLTGVNYLITERPVAAGSRGRQLVVHVHSMAGTAPAAANTSRTAAPAVAPLVVPALEALVAEEAETAAEEREEEEADPDLDELRAAERAKVSELASAGAFGPEANVSALITLAGDGHNHHVRLEAVKALGTRPMSTAVGALVRALGDEAWEVRSAAVDILGRATDAQSLAAVGGLLASDEREIQISALRVIALRADTRSADHVRTLLTMKDVEPEIVQAANQLLAEFDLRARAQRAGDR